MSTPHNALVHRVFGNPDNAASELRLVLPAEASALIDWTTLKLCPGSFVDPQLVERHTDLLFTVRYAGRDAQLYVLFEHQSTPDRFMPFRLLRYIIRIWEAFLRDKLSEIIDLEPSELASFAGLIPELGFVLDDISRSDDEDCEDAVSPQPPRSSCCATLGPARTCSQISSAGLRPWPRSPSRPAA